LPEQNLIVIGKQPCVLRRFTKNTDRIPCQVWRDHPRILSDEQPLSFVGRDITNESRSHHAPYQSCVRNNTITESALTGLYSEADTKPC